MKSFRWMGFALLVLLLATRLPWLGADAGNPGLWGFFFVTDEGEYTSGGRIAALGQTEAGKYVRMSGGRNQLSFVDADLCTPNTFSTSPGMHLLSYWSHCIFGFTFYTARIPTMLAGVMGWMCAYALTARFTRPSIAAWVTLVASCNPVSLTYERTASTDVVCGSMLMLVLLLLYRKHSLGLALGGVLFACATSVKLSALAWLPLLLFVLISRCRTKVWVSLSKFILPAAVSLMGVKLWTLHVMEAVASGFFRGDTVWGFLRFDPYFMLRAFSNFPRFPFNSHVGLLLMALVVLSTWMLFRPTGDKFLKISLRKALALGTLIYTAVFATQNFNSARYFLPTFYLLPSLVVLGRVSMYQVPFVSRSAMGEKKCLAAFSLILALLAGLYWFPTEIKSFELAAYQNGEAFVSKRVLWEIYWPKLLLGILILWVGARFLWPGRWNMQRWIFFLFAGSSWLLLFFSNFLLSLQDLIGTMEEQSYLKWQSFSRNQFVMQMGLCLILLLLMLGMIRKSGGSKIWYGGWFALFLFFSGGNTHWNGAYQTLWKRTYVVADTGEKLAQRLPPNAIVIGQRASTLLRASRLRLGLCSGNGSETFIPAVTRLLEKYPDQPIFWLVESDWDPFWTRYLENDKKAFQVIPLESYPLPSILTPELMPVHLVRIKAHPKNP